MGRNILFDLLIIATLLGLISAVILYMGSEFNKIRHQGKRILAIITDISYVGNTDLSFTREHPYITAKWTDPATGHAYTFWQMADENKPFYKKGNMVPILIDPKHPSFYEMQL